MPVLLLLAVLFMTTPLVAQPIIIAHRGSSGERPEHTLASYERAIDQGADFVEPDLVMTKDGVLVARHENEISTTTNVADKPDFAERRTTKMIDGTSFTGWFTEDFTLAELKTLRAKERLPLLRPANTAFDGQFEIPTMQEIVDLVRAREAATGRRIGLYPETKHPSYFQGIGLPLEQPLTALLVRNGYESADDPVFIQSFEAGNLKQLRDMTKLRLIQLVVNDAAGRAMVSAEGLKEVAAYADGIGPEKALIFPHVPGEPSDVIRDAHAAGLLVHPWTFRSENYFLPARLRKGINPRRKGDAAAEYRLFRDAGVDGVFSDYTADAVAALR